MVRILAMLFLIVFSSLNAGEFTASVDRKQVALGKSLVLTLSLVHASPKGTPDISSLRKGFTIHAQQQSSSTVITNGRMSSSIDWTVTLMPKSEGVFTIPSMFIDTNQGKLYSQPIQIQVSKNGSGADSSSPSDKGITIASSVSSATPYKNEPILYTVKLVSKNNLVNIRLGKIEIEDAIVEMAEEPKLVDRLIDGVKVKVLEIQTLITPLKAGSITIPPTLIQGDIPVKKASRVRSLFDDDFDPFQMLSGFGRLEPFAISTEEIALDVQPPIAGVNPWLPAVSLNIEEYWDNEQKIQVGEPFTRSFNITAVGVKATQLPDLNPQQGGGKEFKVYADKPEMGESIINQNVTSYKKEQYTLIPQKAGTVMLPEINISWWDVITHSLMSAKIPARQLEVLAAPLSTSQNTTAPESIEKSAENQEVPAARDVVMRTDPFLYAVIGAMGLLLLLAFFWVLSLQRKIGRLTDKPNPKAEQQKKRALKIGSDTFSSVQTPRDLYAALQEYAHSKWNAPQNAPLAIVCDLIKAHTPHQHHEEVSSIKASLESALYRDKDIEVAEIVQRCNAILKKSMVVKKTSDKQEKLPALNPH